MTNIIKRLADNVVLYAGDQVTFGSDFVTHQPDPIPQDPVEIEGELVPQPDLIPDPVQVERQFATNGEWRDYGTTPENAVLVDGVELPEPWLGGAYAHDDLEGFTVHDQALLDALTPPVRVPERVTMRQARLALAGAGLLDAVTAAIAAIADPATRAVAEIEWEFSSEVWRHKPLVLMLAPAMGLTSEQLDQLFIAAEAL